MVATTVAEPRTAVTPYRPRGRARFIDPLAIAVLAAVIGAVGAGRPSLWFDESATISASASRSVPELWKLLGHIDAVHGLFYLLMQGWFGVFPATEFWSRVPSCLAVGIAAAGVVVLARQFLPRTHRGLRGHRVRDPAARDVGGHRSTLVCAASGRGRLADRLADHRDTPPPGPAVGVLRARADGLDIAQRLSGVAGAGLRRRHADAAAATIRRGVVGDHVGGGGGSVDATDAVRPRPELPGRLDLTR